MAANPKYIQPPGSSLSVPNDPIWRLSVAQYHKMIRAGVFTDDDPVELLEGWLVTKMPKNPPHRFVTQIVRELIASMLPAGWFIDDQEPITTPDSEPEPDVAVIRGDRRQYLNHHPGPKDLAFVIEVADTTLRRDRSLKKRIYARSGVPCYWIINLKENQVEVYTSPTGPGPQPDYEQRRDYLSDDDLPLVLDGKEIALIAVRDLMP